LFFIIKVLTGVIVSLIYTYYYTDRSTADIYKYFDDSKVMYDALYRKPLDFFRMLFGIHNDNPYFDRNYYSIMNNWYRPYEPNVYNDNHTIIRFNAVVRLVSFGYYNVHTVFMCFFSTIGLLALFKTFFPLLKNKRKELAVLLFLMPSVLFWGSGVLKEGLLLFGLGILLLSFTKLTDKGFSFRFIIGMLIGLLILAYLKYYILTILIPLLISNFITAKTKIRPVFIIYLAVIILFFAILLNIYRIFPQYHVLEILAQKQNSFVYLAEKINAGSIYEHRLLQPDIRDFIIKSPKAFYTVLFRPFIFETDSPFILLAAFENSLLVMATVFCFFFLTFRREYTNMLLFCIFFVIITFVLTGLTTPVLGAVVRYKIPALPFLAITLLLIFDKDKFLRKYNLIKSKFLKDG